MTEPRWILFGLLATLLSFTTPAAAGGVSVACPGTQTEFLDSSCSATLDDYTAMASASGGAIVTQDPAPGTFVSGVGPILVTLTAEDPMDPGFTESCSFDVIFEDVEPPTILCPVSVNVVADPVTMDAAVTGFAAAAFDNCGMVAPMITSDFNGGGADASGTYPIGTTTVTFTATDGSGNTAACSATVTVEAPMPTTVSLTGGFLVEGDTGATVAPLTMTLTPATNVPVTVTVRFMSGTAVSGTDFFPLIDATRVFLPGETSATVPALTVFGDFDYEPDETFTSFIDSISFGTIGTGTATVTILNDDPLTISCPGDQTQHANDMCNSMLLDYTGMASVPNCCGITVTQSPAAGTVLMGVGPTTPVTLTATAASGDTATCTFNVSLVDFTPPTITCPAGVSITAAPGDTMATVSGLIATATDNCGMAPPLVTNSYTMGGADASGDYPIGTTPVTFTATDAAGNTSSCVVQVTVTAAPVVSVASISGGGVVTEGDSGVTTTTVQVSMVPPLTTTMNLQLFTVDGSATVADGDYVTSMGNITFFPGVSLLNFTMEVVGDTVFEANEEFSVQIATLAVGNIVSAPQVVIGNASTTITILNDDSPTILCGAVPPLVADEFCLATVPDYSSSVVLPECCPISLSQDPPPGTTLGIGSHTVTFTANSVNGQQGTCTIDVDVIDTIPPMISCPSTLVVGIEAATTTPANPTLDVLVQLVAVVNGDCSGLTTTNSYTGSGLNATGLYPVGTTTVVFTATDAAGNQGTCSTDVIVERQRAELNYTGPTSGANGTVVCFTAQLLSEGFGSMSPFIMTNQLTNGIAAGIDGQPVTFQLGAQSVTGTTGPGGLVTGCLTLDQPLGTQTLFVTSPGSPILEPSMTASLFEVTGSARVTDCLLTLYEFQEMPGSSVVHDVSGAMSPIDLLIADPTAVTWLPTGGLRLKAATTIKSAGPASLIIQECGDTDEITIEAWVRAENVAQAGPARIVCLSDNGYPAGGNFVLGQDRSDFVQRTRTTDTDQYGRPNLDATNEVRKDSIQHVVYTREAMGRETIYVDGQRVASSIRTGSFAGAWGNYLLSLANEPNLDGQGRDRPWLGDLHLVAIYKKALDEDEVEQNFSAGFGGPGEAPVIINQPTDLTVGAGQTATFSVAATGSPPLQYQWEEFVMSIWQPLLGEDQPTLSIDVVPEMPSGRTFRCLVSNLEGITFSDPAVLFIPAPAPASVQVDVIPDDQTAEQGTDVTIAISVHNDGGIPLIIDEIEGALQCSPLDLIGGDDDNGIIDPGETWAFACFLPNVQSSFCLEVALGVLPVIPDPGGQTFLEAGDTGCVTVVAPPPPLPGRVTDCQLVLYTFHEGMGSNVYDVSGESPSVDLVVDDPSAVNWLPGGGLSVNSPAVISSLVPASRVVTDCKATNEITIEAWLCAANTTQGGPARIVALSDNGFPGGGNAILGQQTDSWRTRARTTTTDQYGKPELDSTTVSTNALQHVVFTRTATGVERLYVDGVLEDTSSTKLGTFSSWGDYPLALANEPNPTAGGEGRPWLGKLYLVAIYSKALSDFGVSQNYAAGPGIMPPPPPPTSDLTILSGPADVTVNVGGTATFAVVTTGGVGPITYRWQERVGGPNWSDIHMETSPTFSIGTTLPTDDGRSFRCLVSDDITTQVSPTAFLTVVQIAPPSLEVTLIPMDGAAVLGQAAFVEARVTNTGPVPIEVRSIVLDPAPIYFEEFRLPPGDIELNPGDSVGFGLLFTTILEDFSYTLVVSGLAEPNGLLVSDSADGSITVVMPQRTTAGLLALYEFHELSGNTVHDSSGVAPPLDLQIHNAGSVLHLPTGGLAVEAPTRICSPGTATKIINGCQSSREITIELWIQSLDDTQTGPARILSLGGNGFPVGSNCVIGQALDQFVSRLRSTTTNQYGMPELRSPGGAFSLDRLHHIVFTRDIAGNQKLYVDGVLVDDQNVAGLFTNWGTDFRLCLANEANDDANGNGRPWIGDLHLVAIYSRALTEPEIIVHRDATPALLHGAPD